MSTTLNDKKIINGWVMYDWANSVFSLTIATAIFPPYFESISKEVAKKTGSAPDGPYYIDVFGYQMVNTTLYSYALSVGFLLVAILSPLLSGIADARGNKKSFLKLFCYMGSAACALMFFFTPDTLFLAVFLFIISLVGFGGSLVYYNAFLPEITTEDQFDRVSARGFSMGYIGSVILLLINLAMVMSPDTLHIDGNMACRLSFVSVGLWWAGFAQIAFRRLPNGTAKEISGNAFAKGFEELKKVWQEIKATNSQNHIKRYLWGFFFTSMGLQTVMYVATIFGSQELKLKTENLIITVLIIQLIAILGAWLFARISAKIGNIYTLLIMVVLWIVICGIAYRITTSNEFYGLAVLVGFVMGGIQSMFRSTYAKIIPDTTPNHASYFSFYDVCEKLAVVLGTFSYGLLLQITGNMRTSVLALALYFIIGLFFIARIKNFKTLHP